MLVELAIGTVLTAITVYQWFSPFGKSSDVVSELTVYNAAIDSISQDCTTILDYYIPNIPISYDDVLIDMCAGIIDCDNTLYDRHKKILTLWESLNYFKHQMFELDQWAPLITHVHTYVELTQSVPSLVPKPFTLKDLNDMVVIECEAVANNGDANIDVVNMCKLVLASQSEFVRMRCIQKLNKVLANTIHKENMRSLQLVIDTHLANIVHSD